MLLEETSKIKDFQSKFREETEFLYLQRRRIIFDYHMRRLTADKMVNETGLRNGCVEKGYPTVVVCYNHSCDRCENFSLPK